MSNSKKNKEETLVDEKAQETTTQDVKEEAVKAEPITEEKASEEDKLKVELDEEKNKYLRLLAEYDNFRKRSAKEKLEFQEAFSKRKA